MGSFVLERTIAAPVERVFALSLDVGVHVESMSAHAERIVGGVGEGSMAEGDTVTWSARHFGMRFRMTSIVFDVDRPRAFSDRQLRGPFAAFRHRHTFAPVPEGTLMRDEIDFRSPLGPVGRLVDALVMRRHLVRLIQQRNDTLAARAERT
ncbi:Ligand-binding SRPBCC domain-containing protein [Microbacterium azadirachtae]|uniref:Ligand-binding SRPBCC domain-containing protein n=1 Tax=Microbacterium azadirachtae TaxID=582680 RepID=A0A1I6I6G6_9MICO|nr:SRPBCC family protein [Microbacterium azadirachtae]SFR62254.1 Ligand-binding SRPBCC domain-containing protein [Microbacterium azadirachtae]